MTLDNKLASMMDALPALSPATPADWDRFVGSAHRSLKMRRFAIAALASTIVVGAGAAYTNMRYYTVQTSLSPATGGDEHASPVEVWFVRSEKLVLTHQFSSAGVTVSEETGGATDHGKQMADALKRLFAATPPELARDGMTSAIPEGTELLGVEFEPNGADAIAVVDVSSDFLSATDRDLATAQIVFTATQLSGVTDVRILVEGEPIEMAGDDRGEFDNRLAPLIVGVMAAEGDRDDHVLYDPARIFGSVKFEQGDKLAFELVDNEGNLVAKGSIKLQRGRTNAGERVGCARGDGCRLGYERFIRFEVVEETQGVLRVFIRRGGERLFETSVPVLLAPDRD